mmetsp:Transcript_37631/g.107497  ORF Transcript_37631/g.107497 Transcript_37631/m.107497 type:complete len:259 (-) Transcript_37631:328-1104(-)
MSSPAADTPRWLRSSINLIFKRFDALENAIRCLPGRTLPLAGDDSLHRVLRLADIVPLPNPRPEPTLSDERSVPAHTWNVNAPVFHPHGAEVGRGPNRSLAPSADGPALVCTPRVSRSSDSNSGVMLTLGSWELLPSVGAWLRSPTPSGSLQHTVADMSVSAMGNATPDDVTSAVEPDLQWLTVEMLQCLIDRIGLNMRRQQKRIEACRVLDPADRKYMVQLEILLRLFTESLAAQRAGQQSEAVAMYHKAAGLMDKC